jgi:hypothetical protein
MALSVPKPVSLAIPGIPFFQDVVVCTTPGVEQNLIDFTVPTGILRSLQQVVVICRMEGYFKVILNSELIGSGRTGAAQPNATFSWIPSRAILAGMEIQVVFQARIKSPIVSVEAYLQASDTSV